jgi:hypothetical protein
MNKLLPSLLLWSSLFGAACAHAPMSGVTEEGARVDVGKGDPSKDMVELGAFEAADPPACTSDRKAGTEDGAMMSLRNRAGQLRADYVQIFRTDTDSCNRVVIRAMAFRRPDAAGDNAKPASN